METLFTQYADHLYNEIYMYTTPWLLGEYRYAYISQNDVY